MSHLLHRIAASLTIAGVLVVAAPIGEAGAAPAPITISPAAAAPGSIVTVSGRGCLPGLVHNLLDHATVTLAGASPVIAKVAGDGTWSAKLQLPGNATGGLAIKAECATDGLIGSLIGYVDATVQVLTGLTPATDPQLSVSLPLGGNSGVGINDVAAQSTAVTTTIPATATTTIPTAAPTTTIPMRDTAPWTVTTEGPDQGDVPLGAPAAHGLASTGGSTGATGPSGGAGAPGTARPGTAGDSGPVGASGGSATEPGTIGVVGSAARLEAVEAAAKSPLATGPESWPFGTWVLIGIALGLIGTIVYRLHTAGRRDDRRRLRNLQTWDRWHRPTFS